MLTTRMAAEALSKIDVTLVDHVIVAGEHFLSLASSRILPEVFSEGEEKPLKKLADRRKKRELP